MLATEFRITHAFGIFLKVIGLLTDFVGYFWRRGVQRTQELNQLLDLALIEFGLVAQNPLFLMSLVAWVKEASQVPKMLAGMK